MTPRGVDEEKKISKEIKTFEVERTIKKFQDGIVVFANTLDTEK